MVFFSIRVRGDCVELVGGKMNALSCVKMTISSVVVHGERRNWAQSAQYVDCFLAMFAYRLLILQSYQITHVWQS